MLLCYINEYCRQSLINTTQFVDLHAAQTLMSALIPPISLQLLTKVIELCTFAAVYVLCHTQNILTEYID